MFEFVWNFVSFVIALGILITVHEYGHYWVARKNGVKVHRFAIGFGKPLWRKVDKNGTEFVIAAIPLGGYVKMLDERVENVPSALKSQAFNNKSVYQRIAIIAAGPGANFIFAIFAFYLMLMIGVPSVKPILGTIGSDSIAAKAGIQGNSEIVEIAGKETKDWSDVNLALVGQIGAENITIKLRYLDSVSTTSFTLDTHNWQFSPEKTSAITSLGLSPYRSKIHNEVAAVLKNSAAERGGLKKGDVVISINNLTINNDWNLFTREIKASANKEISLNVLRDGNTIELIVKPDGRKQGNEVIGYLGVSPKSDPYPKEFQFVAQYGPIEAITESLYKTWDLVVLSFDMIGKLITGDVSVKNLSGPISIAQGAGNSADYGFVYFLGFLALISINLGIINILPLPVLDGGHLVYYLIELLTGKPVPERVQELGFKFGALVILGIMSIAIFNDLSRL